MMALTTLANGLRVASRPMQSVETVAVGLYAPTGSRYEPAALNGVAHMFEHMVFKGAGGRSAREISEAVEDVGGDLNASTERELTAFYATLLAPDLALGVELAGRPRPPAAFRPRAPRAREEGRRCRNWPRRATRHRTSFSTICRKPLSPNSRLAGSVLGSEATHPARSPSTTCRPGCDPISRVRIGAGRGREARTSATGRSRQDGISATWLPSAAFAARAGELYRRPALRPASRASRPILPWRCPRRAGARPTLFASQLFADVIGAGSSSRLFQELREEQGLAYSVAPARRISPGPGCSGPTSPRPRRRRAVHREIERILPRHASSASSEREVERARAMAKAGLLMNLESCWGQASYLATRLLRDGAAGRAGRDGRAARRRDARRSARGRASDACRAARDRDGRRASSRSRRVSELTTIVAEPWDDWGLIDCGNGQKLERYGPVTVVRPEPQAMWAPARDDWDPDATFVPGSDEEGGGRWVQHRPVPKQWALARGAVRFDASLTPFRHLGFFPDMAPQWDWMRERCADAEVLNLFGYTGVGTLLLSDAGARLVHVDASKKSVEQGKDNARCRGWSDRPIRWIVDDAAQVHRARGAARAAL